MKPPKTKELLLEFCKAFVADRKQQILENIARIEESLLSEGKSTAGDKHHTGRAMLQLDRENAGKQLQEIEKLETLLGKIDITRSSDRVALGSLVVTPSDRYFLSISAGVHSKGGLNTYCISPGTPIGRLLLGKKQGDTVVFREKEIQIVEVY
ncbi:3-oxoacyl-ACP synthase [Aureisphaera galaxeae]|uniref:3-oxoacyl-ACP synthase n=1 Tax=Aureisphaera galaxeae TaxID=1538023 RepID=UPI002350B557|nr:3-oxoacyl-ACP synthase [Aureisphaera galaxeae]MDC8005139.1 3-oxoacyl-ACP synthase [Aureisphaera galaxeae]